MKSGLGTRAILPLQVAHSFKVLLNQCENIKSKAYFENEEPLETSYVGR